MELILGGAGLFVAISALWLASHAMRKADGQAEELIRVYFGRLKAEIAVVAKSAAEAQRKNEALEKEIKNLAKKHDDDMARFRTSVKEMARKRAKPMAAPVVQEDVARQPRLD